jgi:hypothetical protein
MQAKINIGFSRIPDGDLDEKAKHIITSLTGNANFPTPSPTLATVQTALDEYEDALALDQSPTRTATVEVKREMLENLLQQLGVYVSTTANGDKDKLVTSGFEMRKDPTQTEADVAAPANLRLKSTGTTGEVQLLCDAVDRARNYQVQHTQNPNAGPWIDNGLFASTRGIKISG